jgi:hypothetical protein
MNMQIVQHGAASGNGGFGAPPATMSSREIASLTAKRHDHVKRDIEKMLGDLGEDVPSFGAIYSDTRNRQQLEYLLDRELTETLLTGYSVSLRRRVIRRWRELEGAAPALTHTVVPSKVVGELAIFECFTRMLRPAPSVQIGMLGGIAKQNGLDGAFLPAYAVDAAPDATAGSSMPTKPLTDLLRDHSIGYTAKAYNQLLRDIGMLEERTRRSAKPGSDQLKKFWCITEAGMRFGKNLTSPSSPRETQPHWYAERFMGLHELVLGRLAGGRR